MDDELMAKYQRLVAQGTDTDEAVKDLQQDARISDPPPEFNTWITTNAERVDGWKARPFWWKDNDKFITSVLKTV